MKIFKRFGFFTFYHSVSSISGFNGENALKNKQTMVDLSLAFLMFPSPFPTLVLECVRILHFSNG